MTLNTQQSEALQLAVALENLEATGCGDCFSLTEYSEKQANLAAAELRRLHEVNAELLEALKTVIKHPDTMTARLVALSAIQKVDNKPRL
jgi:hypothetical protein